METCPIVSTTVTTLVVNAIHALATAFTRISVTMKKILSGLWPIIDLKIGAETNRKIVTVSQQWIITCSKGFYTFYKLVGKTAYQ